MARRFRLLIAMTTLLGLSGIALAACGPESGVRDGFGHEVNTGTGTTVPGSTNATAR